MPPRKQGGKVCPADHKHAKNATCYTAHECRCAPCRERGTAYRRWARATPNERMARTHVNAIGTRRRMRALMALGYSPAEMARRLGHHPQLVWRWAKQDTVTRLTAARIRGLYDELTRLPAPNPTDRYLRSAVTKTRRMAERAGWATPDAWWDVDIDDPDAEPDMAVEPDSTGWVVNELDHLHALGESPAQAAMQLHGDRASLARQARRHRRPDLAVWLGEKAKKAA